MSKKVDLALAMLKHIAAPGWRANALVKLLLGCAALVKPRKKVAMKNFELIFPNATQEQKKLWLSQCYENLALMSVEMLAWQDNPAVLNDFAVEVSGQKYFDEAFARGKGALLMTAHYSNWEFLVAWTGYNYNFSGIAQHNKSAFQKELINRLRTSAGTKIIGKEEPMLRAISVLKNNAALGLISDQHTGSEGILAPFFDIPCSTAQGLAVFAYLTKAPIIPVRTLRLAPYKFKIEISPPIEWEKKATRDETVYDIVCKTNHVFEAWIKDAPGEWLWLHKRYKDVVEY